MTTVNLTMLSAETWNCSKCTFSNHNNNKCEMCGNINTMKNESKSNIWRCAQCTFENSIDHQQCQICKCSRDEEKTYKVNKRPKDDSSDDTTKDVDYAMKNPVVLIICVGEYEKEKDLQGA
eukprot:177942_1